MIVVGSLNPAKVQAVRETFTMFHKYNSITVLAYDAKSNVSHQPHSLQETIQGAINRTYDVLDAYFDTRDILAVGIESGIFDLEDNNLTNYLNHPMLDVCVCAIGDGKDLRLGFSSAWALPQEMSKMLEDHSVNMNDAVVKMELSNNTKVGYSEGAIGILSNNLLTRKSHTQQAILAAMIGWTNK